jgi:cytochrome P450
VTITRGKVPSPLWPEWEVDPYACYQVLRDEYPVVYDELSSSYLVSRYADVDTLLKHPLTTTRCYDWQIEPVHGRTVLQMESTEHSAHRSLISPVFRSGGLESRVGGVVEACAERLIGDLRGRQEADLYAEFASRFPVMVIAELLCLPEEDLPQFQKWYSSIIAFLGNIAADEAVSSRGLAAAAEFRQYVRPVIADRRAGSGTDLISHLCQAEVDGYQLTDEEICSFCSLLLVAGGETSDKAIASLIRNLLDHPEQLASVTEDTSLVDRAFAETLRFSPPAHLIFREVSGDVELGGGTVPSGSLVTVLLASANRDPAEYGDPETFNLFRDDLRAERAFTGAAHHTAFSLGRHFCAGSHLARLEVNVGMSAMLASLRNLRWADGEHPKEEGVYTRGPRTLRVAYDG